MVAKSFQLEVIHFFMQVLQFLLSAKTVIYTPDNGT